MDVSTILRLECKMNYLLIIYVDFMFFDFEKYYNKKKPNKPLFIEVGANKGQWQNILTANIN
jgi:hypothetical protein